MAAPALMSGELYLMSANEKRDAGLFWALLLLIAVLPTQWGVDLKPIHVTPADVVLGVAFLLWLGMAARRRADVAVPPTCIWALLGVALVSAINAAKAAKTGTPFTFVTPGFAIDGDPKKSLAEMVQLVEYFVVAYVVVAAALNNERQARTAGLVLVGITALVVLGGLYHYVTLPASEVHFVGSALHSRHIYGGFLAMALPVAFALALRAEVLRLRLGLLALVVVGALTVLSPGAMIGLVVALLLVAWKSSPRAFQLTLAGTLAFAALAAIALPRNYDHNVYQLLHFRSADPETGEENLRAQWREWIAGAYMVQEQPVLGVGPGNFQRNLQATYDSHGVLYPGKARSHADVARGEMEEDTNSLYVVTAGSMGLLGLAALLWVLLFFGKVAGAASRRAGDEALKALALGIWAGIIGVAITSAFSSLLVRGPGVLLAIYFAIATVLRQREWAAAEGEGGTRGLYIV